MENAPLLLPVPEAGQMLGLGRSRIYELIDAGAIQSLKIGKRRLVIVESLKSFVQRLASEQSGA